MADLNDQDDHDVVADLAQDPVVADPVTPQSLGAERSPERTWALGPLDALGHEAHDGSRTPAI
jgi:hypothetical protein